MRMQRELAEEGGGPYDPKLGRGGLLDVALAVQWLQMFHGTRLQVRSSNTAEALADLGALGRCLSLMWRACWRTTPFCAVWNSGCDSWTAAEWRFWMPQPPTSMHSLGVLECTPRPK
ncbi:MAG: hypothetical protein HRU17_22540 [Polyangiaceae bacterium]|nr:hypothetical protein [Polyangiaceae bacterium]